MRKFPLTVLGCLIVLIAANARAATFSLFSPATGILKGSASTYVTSAAASSDIIGLWTGTCNTTTFLRADGICATAGSGTVTSIALTAPSIFSVTGSPVTTSGTINFAYSGAQGDIIYASASSTLAALAKSTSATRYLSNTGASNNPAWAQIDLTTGVTGILPAANGGNGNGFFAVSGPATSTKTFTFPNASATVLTSNAAVTVAQGGTGVATLTSHGVLLGQGTSNITALLMGADTVLRGTASADPVATAVPNCGSSTQALAYSTSSHAFSCQTISAGSPSFPLLAPVGSAGAPSYSFTGNATSGIWNANPGLEIVDPTNIDIVSSGTITVATTSGATLGSPTGGAQGSGTLNAEGLYVNGIAVGAPFSGAGVHSGGSTSCGVGSYCAIAYSAEDYDTGSFHDTVTNNSRILLPHGSGYAQCAASVTITTGTTTAVSNHAIEVIVTVNGQPGVGTTYGQASQNFYENGAGSIFVTTMTATTGPIPTSNGTDYAQAYFDTQGFSSNGSAGTNSASQPNRFWCWAVQ